MLKLGNRTSQALSALSGLMMLLCSFHTLLCPIAVHGQQRALPFAAAPLDGQWESEWGPVTFKTTPIRSGERAQVSGYWIQEGNKKGSFTKGEFDYLSGLLTLSYYEDWKNVSGVAALTMSRDFQTMRGNWSQSDGFKGNWEIRRAGSLSNASGSFNSSGTTGSASSSADATTASATSVMAAPRRSRQAIIADTNREVQECSQGLKQKPDDTDLLLQRAFLYLALGDTSNASADAGHILQLFPSIKSNEDEQFQQLAVIILWLSYEKAGDRANQSALLKQAEVKCNPDIWPYPLIKYFSGTGNEALIQGNTSLQKIESSFFQGMALMCRAKFKEATVSFEKSLSVPSNGNSRTNFYQDLARRMITILQG